MNGSLNLSSSFNQSRYSTEEERLRKEQCRDIREKYKTLFKDVGSRGTDDPEILKESLNEVERLYQCVDAPREAVYDSAVVNLQSRIINHKTQTLHTNLTSFMPNIFVEKMQCFLEEKSVTSKKSTAIEMWNFLGKSSIPVVNSTPSLNLLYGTFEPGEVEVKKKQRRARYKEDSNHDVTNVVTLDSPGGENASLNIKEAERILSILHRLYEKLKHPICYFEFVINPQSFSDTIENIFYVSILVKEAVVNIYLDPEGLPVIEPVIGDGSKEAKIHGVYVQSVLSLSIEKWKKLIEAFKLEGKKPLILPRKKKRL